MRLRLALAPNPVRFLVMAVYWTVFWTLGTSLAWGPPDTDIRITAIVSLVSGLVFAFLLVGWSRPRHEQLVDAVAGLDRVGRSEAITAVTRGVVPADPAVRSSAIRLGTAFLGDTSVQELKRQELFAWAGLAFFTVMLTPIAMFAPGSHPGLFFFALALLVLLACWLDARSTRRVLHNVTLAERG